MLITNSNSPNSNLRQKTVNREIKIGPLSIQFIVIIVLAAMALLYLAQSTQSATKNYKLQEVRDQKAQIESETERLEVEATRLKSLSEIEKNAENLDLVSAD